MKKFLVVLTVLIFATGAFAQDAAKKGAEFKYGMWATSYVDSTAFKAGNEKVSYDYTHVRVRPSFSVENENVKGVVVFEIDQDFGANSAFDDEARGSADPGTDNTVVEVKHAYIQVKDILTPGLSAKTGLMAFYAPLLVDNDFGMTAFSYDFGMGSVNASYIKLAENQIISKWGETQDDGTVESGTIKDDVQTYAIDAVVKAGTINVKPVFLYTQFGRDNVLAERKAAADSDDEKYTYCDGAMWNAGINVSGEMDALGFDITYVQTGGKAKKSTYGAFASPDDNIIVTAEKQKFSTYAFDFLVTYKVAPATIGAFVTLYSGDDKSDDNKIQSHVALMDKVFGAPDGRLFILDAAGSTGNGGIQAFDDGANGLGLRIFGLNAEAAFGKAKVFAQYGYVQSAKKMVVSADSKKTLTAQEIDLSGSLEVAPATNLFVEYSYVMMSKEWAESDKKGTISSIVAGITTKI